jgi:serine/threonine protein kinase
VPGYRLVKRLGRGQFGEVWQATAAGGIDVAIKIIDLGGREGLQEFLALQAVKHVRHPNLIQLQGAWLKTEEGEVLDSSAVQAEGSGTRGDYEEALKRASHGQPLAELIVAMGLGSKSLFDRLKECQTEKHAGIPLDELLSYMEQAARGIDYLNKPIHDTGYGPRPIIHCDIKPHNLLIVGDAVQVGDFGLARALEGLRRTATVMATFAYAAPELLDGKRHERSDQYCLAVTYVELRTGELPFNETNPLLVADLHRRGKLDLSRLPRAEQKVIRKATSPNPARRWTTCSEMVTELREKCKKSPRTLVRSARVDAGDERFSTVGGTALPPQESAREPSGHTSPKQPAETQIYSQGPTVGYLDEEETPGSRRLLGWFAVLTVLGLLVTADVLWVGWSRQLYQRAAGWWASRSVPQAMVVQPKDQEPVAAAEATPSAVQTAPKAKPIAAELPLHPAKTASPPADEGPEGQLGQARRLVAVGSWAEADKILERLKPAEWKGREPTAALCHALRIIAIRNQGARVEALLASAAGNRLLQALEDYDRSQGRSAPTVKEEERVQVEAIRSEVLDALVPGRLAALQKDPKAAAKVLQSAERIGGRERKPFELATWTAIFQLSAPTLTLAELKACLAPLEKAGENEPWRLDRETTKALSQAVELAVSRDWPAAERRGLLDRAIALERAARTRFPVGLDSRLGALLPRWVELRYVDDRVPDAKEFDAFEEDWRVAERSGQRSALVTWWRAECLAEVKREPDAARDLVFSAPEAPATKPNADALAYGAYVRCLVMQGQVGDPPEVLVTALTELLADANRSSRVLLAQGRLAKACRWASKAAAERRKAMRPWTVFPPAEADPFSSSAEAATYAELLSRVLAAGPLTAGARREAILDLVLAASRSTAPDGEKIGSLVRELLDASSQRPDQDESRGLYAYLRICVTGAQWPSLPKDGEATLVRACTRLLEFRETMSIPFGTSDTAILESLLRWSPSGKAVEPIELEKYCWSMARFMAEQSGAHWKEKNLRKYVAQLLSQAIDLHQQRPAVDDPARRQKEQAELARYHAARARARAEQPEPDLESLLADADAAIRLDDSQPESHAMRSHACLLLSRRQARRGELLAYLDKAIGEGERAVALCRDTERSLPSWLLNLSSAYVEKANYEPSSAEGLVAKWLTEARKHAERAERLRQNLKYQADYPYLAQGNAYEDLAWLAEVDAAENYKRAIAAFREATKQRLYPAEAWTGVGRCYYRAVAETFIKPEDLGLRSNDAVLTEADNAFTEALKADNRQAEASLNRAMIALYRAMIAQADKQTDQAEKYFEQAEKAYDQAKAMVCTADHPLYRDRLMYVVQWARFPLYDQRRSAEKQAAEALSRLSAVGEDLPAPLGGWIETRKERAYIRGLVLVREQKFSEASELYSQALPSNLANADVSDYDLLMARAQCAEPLYTRDKDKDRQVFARAAADAQRAAEVAKRHSMAAGAHRQAFEACYKYCMTYYDRTAEVLNPEAKADWLPYYQKAVDHCATALEKSPRNPQRARWLIELASVRGLARHVLSLPEQIANYRECVKNVEEALKAVGDEAPDYKRIRDNELGVLKTRLREKIDLRITEIDQAIAAADTPALREERKELENVKKELP